MEYRLVKRMESGRQYLDTNIIAILHSGEVKKLSRKCFAILKKNLVFHFSPMVKLELEYLFEVKRIRYSAEIIIKDLQQIMNLKECDISFGRVITESTKHNWTRDPFDRIIVAQASLNKNKLLSHDRLILKNYKQAVW